MCYNFNNKKVSLKKAVEDLGAEEYEEENFVLNGSINAFTKQTTPTIPAVVNHNGIVLMNTFWGVKENPDTPTKGKNLQSENTHTYYRKIKKNRCLIPASSYFEHKSIPVPGKKTPVKAKHEMFWKDKAQFYIAGFFDVYTDGNLGFGLVTTLPNLVQAEIHDRMIITLDAKTGKEFLELEPIEKFQYPNYSPNLEYINLEPEKTPHTLF
ncbi:SOS response-associated peptidase family protein [uncultured Chryseobacterium sp.]|uniref:SOS response-associated peptidase family protein n=1 Tax=uncultured Chryseobacterium sp. TaxID=259322 RepID=UPI0025E45E1B|nr:SOS response-associated peptidase family protein [uncultured Chryseobacterium sp.]